MTGGRGCLSGGCDHSVLRIFGGGSILDVPPVDRATKYAVQKGQRLADGRRPGARSLQVREELIPASLGQTITAGATLAASRKCRAHLDGWACAMGGGAGPAQRQNGVSCT